MTKEMTREEFQKLPFRYIVIRADVLGRSSRFERRFVTARKVDEDHAIPVHFTSGFRSAKSARRKIRRELGGEVEGVIWTIDNRTFAANRPECPLQDGHNIPVLRVR